MRKTRLIDCDPRWAGWTNPDATDIPGVADALRFDCPEADGGCGSHHVIPLKQALDGSLRANGWDRYGDAFATLTITPSLRCRGACQIHINITDGGIVFHGDSKSGPDWGRRGE